MRRINSLFIVISLLVMAVGCNKAEKESPNNQSNEPISVTLTTGGISVATKTNINPQENANLDIQWTAGDEIYVASDTDGYIGVLVIDDNSIDGSKAQFSGYITPSASATKLNFFYFGKGRSVSLQNGAKSLEYSIATQNQPDTVVNGITNYRSVNYNHLLVASVAKTTGSRLVYNNVKFNSLVAILNINLSQLVDASNNPLAINLDGPNVFNRATLNLQTGELEEVSTEYEGNISIGNAGMKYVVLIPTSRPVSLSFTTNLIGKQASIFRSSVAEKFYIYHRAEPVKPLHGIFSVSETKTVSFSPGNLIYNKNNIPGRWGFHDEQNGSCEYSTNNMPMTTSRYSRNNTTNPGLEIDLFGWCANGLPGQAQPYRRDTGDSPFPPATFTEYNTTYSESRKWGNAVVNDLGTNWHLLKDTEWHYLFTRPNRGTFAIVGDFMGHIFMPDSWDGTFTSSEIFKPNNTTEVLVYNESSTPKWSEMEEAGAIFLPSNGYRDDNSISNNASYAYYTKGYWGNNGYYWSDTMIYGNTCKALYLAKERFEENFNSNRNRRNGCSIRLCTTVYDASEVSE